MFAANIVFECPGLRVTDVAIEADAVTIRVESTAPTAACPRCGAAAARVHSRYTRTVADRPISGRPVVLSVLARRFRCGVSSCPRAVFCERLPQLTAPHARTTGPLADAHRDIGLALGGEAGSRLAARLAIPTSPDTLLRRVKATPDEPSPPPRYVGIDDWAIRKGQNYGTIVIDLERRRVIDILPGRDGAALRAWLAEHPGVEVVTRDRWAALADAVRAAAPAARQVADRWHLLKNLREAVERLFARFGPEISRLAPPPAPAGAAAAPAGAGAAPPAGLAPAVATPTPPPSPHDPARRAKHAAREERHRHARGLRDQGVSIRQTAGRLGVSVNTVIRYRRQEACPDWKPGRGGPSRLDEHRVLVGEWVQGGGRNAAELHRLLAARGFRVSYAAVPRYVSPRLGGTCRQGRRAGGAAPPRPSIPSARRLSSQFINPPKVGADEPTTGAAEPRLLDRVRAGIPGLEAALEVASEFASMLRKEVARPLSGWLAKAEGSGVGELAAFARGLRDDEAAVSAALTDAWSNGQVEGQVNRLKCIKRSMYGRAGRRLLRARVTRKG